MDQLFGVCNLLAMSGWVLLVAAPRWRWTERLVLSGAWSLLLSVVYLVLAVAFFPGAEGGFGSIGDVRLLFSTDPVLTAGWVHYLAFDLFVGAAEVRLAQRYGLPHLVVIPILILTFLFGPVGLVLFFVACSIHQKRAVAVVP
jgi:hypothetical protein